MHAKLMGASGERSQLQPSQFLPGVVERAVLGDRAGGVLVVALGRSGALAGGTADTLERQVDAAFGRDGAAGGDGPVGLLHVPATERGGQPRGRAGRAGEDQHAGRVAVQPMHEARPMLRPEAQRIEPRVEMAGNSGATLHRQAMRLVQHQQVLVPIQDQTLQILGQAGIDFSGPPWGGGWCQRQRWNADGLAGRQTRGGVSAMSVHPHLTAAAQLLNGALRQAGEMPPEPSIETDLRFVFRHGHEFSHGSPV